MGEVTKDNVFVSIHAPARGATGFWALQEAQLRVSIHAPARGATGDFGDFHEYIEVSIHAPARGATDVSNALVR